MPGLLWGVMNDKQYYVASGRAAVKGIFSRINNAKSIKVIITNDFGM